MKSIQISLEQAAWLP